MGRRLLATAWLIAALLLAATLPASADKDGRDGDGESGEGRGGNGRRDRDKERGAQDDDAHERDGDGDDGGGRDEEDDEDDDERKGRKPKPSGEGRSPRDLGPGREVPMPRLVLRQDVDAAGGSATYTLAVHNAGTVQAGAVAIEADLPAGTWTSPDPACEVVADHLSCALGPIAAGGRRVLEAQGTVTERPFPVVVQAVTPLGDSDPSVP